jgi:hypothetical protein
MSYEPSNIQHAYYDFLQNRQPPHNLVMNLHGILCPSHIQFKILPKDDNEL